MNPLTVRSHKETYDFNLIMKMSPYFEAIRNLALLDGLQFV